MLFQVFSHKKIIGNKTLSAEKRRTTNETVSSTKVCELNSGEENPVERGAISTIG